MVSVERVRLAYNNAYIVEDGADVVLIDTGPDYRGARETVLASLGRRVPNAVVATHGHLDHAGMGNWWQSRGVPVVLGAADLPYARGTESDFEELAGYVRECGAPAAVAAEVLHGLEARRQWHDHLRDGEGWLEARDGRWPTQLRYAPFEPHTILVGETALPCGLRAVLTPGHTPGNLVVVHEGNGWLFSGDQLLPEITPTPAIQFSGGARYASLPRFLDSLRTLQGRGPWTRCYPGHGEPFEDVNGLIAENLSQAEVRSKRLLETLKGDGPGTVYELAERMYPRALRRRFWQIIATVQGHLDVLEEQTSAAVVGNAWVARQ